MPMVLPMAAQVPEYYRSVDRLTWVVDDVDRVTGAWEKFGLARIERRQNLELAVTFRGKPANAKVKMVSGFLGDVRVDWIQPLGGTNAFAEYRKKHGSGVLSLMHRLPGADAFEQEIERLRGAGVNVLQRWDYETGAGKIQSAYMDTEGEGKYVLGLIYLPEGSAPEAAGVAPDNKITQIAFAVHDLKPVADYWIKAGLGAIAINPSNLSECQYGGKPVEIRMSMGFQRGRKVPYEWIQPVTSPNIFDDHMKTHGEGLQHFGIGGVPDMEKAIADWNRMGPAVSQLGAWGEKGKPRSGRFAFLDTELFGGVSTELTWQFR